CSCRATTSASRATSTTRTTCPNGSEGGSERRELLLQFRRHRLVAALADEPAQALLEPVAPRTVRAPGEGPLGLRDLAVAEHTVEVGLHGLLALHARIDLVAGHHDPPVVARSASSRFRIRLPR